MDAIFKNYSKKNADFQLGIKNFCHTPQDNPEQHCHLDFYELVIVESGEAMHIHNESSFPIQSGSVFLIAPVEKHGYEITEQLKIFNILFKHDILDTFYYDLTGFPGFQMLFSGVLNSNGKRLLSSLAIGAENFFPILKECGKMLEILKTHGPGYRTAATSIFLNILYQLALYTKAVDHEKAADTTNLSKVISYMKSNYNQNLSLEFMARKAGMSVSSFQKKFSTLMNTSPGNFLLLLRLEGAKESMFLHRHKNIAEIALENGFYDGNYLARCFKKYYGQTPSEFRKNINDQQYSV